jgi:biotin operon repressor/transposase
VVNIPKITWNEEDINYLEDAWGRVSIKTIAKKLNKTETAVELKAERLGLCGCYITGDYLNAHTVAKMLSIDTHTVTDYWIAKCGLKGRKTILKSMSMWFISLENLMKWLKNNQDKWNSRRVELYALGTEPQWLKDKRKQDLKLPKRQRQKWTKEEISKLITYYTQGKTRKEIGKLLGRTEDGIQRKLSRLKENGTIPKSKIMCKWSNREEKMFKKLESKGLKDKDIAVELGREVIHIVDHRRNLRNKGLYQGKKITI